MTEMHKDNRIMPSGRQSRAGHSEGIKEIKAPLHSIVMLVFLLCGISLGIILVFLILMILGLAAAN